MEHCYRTAKQTVQSRVTVEPFGPGWLLCERSLPLGSEDSSRLVRLEYAEMGEKSVIPDFFLFSKPRGQVVMCGV